MWRAPTKLATILPRFQPAADTSKAEKTSIDTIFLSSTKSWSVASRNMANRIGGLHFKISENLACDVQSMADPGSLRAMARSKFGL